MMYICLTASQVNSPIPDGMVDRFGFTRPICDENTVEIGREDVHPTWEQLINRQDVTDPIWSKDESLCLVKVDASFLLGEVPGLLAMGTGMTYPNNSVLNEEEYTTLKNSALFV